MNTQYSVKMRAAKDKDHRLGGKHISGAERIVDEAQLEEVCKSMVRRALCHPKGKADFINITIQNLEGKSVQYIEALDISEPHVTNRIETLEYVEKVLNTFKIDTRVLEKLQSIQDMRGAMLLDAYTLERLDGLDQRGVRVSTMDYNKELDIEGYLLKYGFTGKYVKDAIALSSKVASAPGVLLELCWSDDPLYTTGYIAGKSIGYIRLNHFKPIQHQSGGRIILVDTHVVKVDVLVEYLQNQAVIINSYPLMVEAK